MDTRFNGNRTVRLTATCENLLNINGSGQKIWATPNTDGKISSVYVNGQPSWASDFVCARPEDFEGCGVNFSDADMTREEIESVLEDEYSLTLPV